MSKGFVCTVGKGVLVVGWGVRGVGWEERGEGFRFFLYVFLCYFDVIIIW